MEYTRSCIDFTEGEYAIIYVKNEMKEETSIHYVRLVLLKFYDGTVSKYSSH
jgi:hypothetical protein